MPYLPYPRRTRRHLLLPPGLLALAWLLWLGCVAVPQLGDGPPPKVFALFTPRHLESGWHTNLFSWQPQDRPNQLVISNTVHVTPSSIWLTYFFAQQLRFILPRNNGNSIWQGSVFKFDGRQSADEAAALISILERQPDLLYWFANFPPANVAYVFKLPPPGPVECTGYIQPVVIYSKCTLCGDVMPFQEPMTLVRVNDIIVSNIAFYLAPEWRNIWFLLLLIGGLSAVRMGRR